MRYHHTKNKGDLGAIKAMADMAEKGWSIFTGLSEHQAFDFAAYREGRFLRVQAKYRAVANGVIPLWLSTCWADRHGVHTNPIDRDSVDLLAIHCPDTERCYYLDPKSVARDYICLRVTAPRNNQTKQVRWANDYLEIPSSVRGIRAGEASGLVGWGWVRQSPPTRAA